jgi:hypothetical protein
MGKEVISGIIAGQILGVEVTIIGREMAKCDGAGHGGHGGGHGGGHATADHGDASSGSHDSSKSHGDAGTHGDASAHKSQSDAGTTHHGDAGADKDSASGQPSSDAGGSNDVTSSDVSTTDQSADAAE